MNESILPFSKDAPEHPRKITLFGETVDSILGKLPITPESLNLLFSAVDELAEAELRYYFRRRRTRAVLSGVFRTIAWLSVTIGLIIPLVAAANAPRFGYIGLWGYVALALGASMLAANSLFGGSSGHVRFVVAQLEMERLITLMRLKWIEISIDNKIDEKPNKSKFEKQIELIQEYAEKMYVTTIAETSEWGKSLMAELERFADRAKPSAKGSGTG